MTMKRNIRFAGAGGQGVILSSVLLAKAYGLEKGYNISQTQSYGPEARGGACKAELIISDKEIDYMKVGKADYFIAFSQEGFDKFKEQTTEDGVVLINSTLIETDRPGVHKIPATEIADNLNAPKTVNMVMMGALTALLDDLDFEIMKHVVSNNTSDSYRNANVTAFDKGYARLEYTSESEAAHTRQSIMVGVTSQKKCDRLIRKGKELLATGGELSIIHVADTKFSNFDTTREGEVLDYLYESALQHSANLMIIRASNVIDTIEKLIKNNNVDCFVIGESREVDPKNNLNVEIRERISAQAELVIVPSEE